jgi:predicted transcriptional regulator
MGILNGTPDFAIDYVRICTTKMHTMQQMIRIHDLIARARSLNLPESRFYRRAGVTHTTVQRWLSGEVSPRLNTLERVTAQLEAELQAEETRLRGLLAGKPVEEDISNAA